ncbi:heterokaryon incompatibility protein-domain-containing protein [Cadophora sp. MPI-SDFR-AT-0126]|nr:heterokaryon incompatibility protein-domain-containing protein [Leotiomycetes sp. MPI-SDFR-AT-0126]
MRLLNTSTLKLESFFGREIPIYAILSHTWGDDEVTLQDMANPTEAEQKLGYVKLRGCCNKAANDGYSYVWIDTCCIDKTSSAELSEAINSMYMWYKSSDVCYAYLSDVPNPFEVYDSSGTRIYTLPKAFKHSKWFTRGWTLQELIAPATVEFYTASWEEIGTKQSLTVQIAAITHIASRALQGRDLSLYNVAERMSWAASRATSRVEDMSYCLLGLFNIHMPLLYGEGNRAFIRLQGEIMRTIDDYTILARGFWATTTWKYMPRIAPSIVSQQWPLATSISEFSMAGRPDEQRYSNLIPDNSWAPTVDEQRNTTGGLAQPPLLLTAKGLLVTLPIQKVSGSTFLAYLHCKLRTSNEIVCMVLTEISPGQFQRNGRDGFESRIYRYMPPEALQSFEIASFYIQQNTPRPLIYTVSLPARLPITVEVESTAIGANCNFYFSESQNISAPGPEQQFNEVDLPANRSYWYWPGILYAPGNHDSFLITFGNKHGRSGSQYWCHYSPLPADELDELKAAWSSHSGVASLKVNSPWWEHVRNFIPENPQDRLRESLGSGSGTVSVSIKKYPPVPDRDLERRLVVKIRLEKF